MFLWHRTWHWKKHAVFNGKGIQGVNIFDIDTLFPWATKESDYKTKH